MRIGVITGSGGYEWPHLDVPATREVVTGHDPVTVTGGRLGDVDVVRLSRHRAGHRRLSHQVDHKAGMASLRVLGVDAAGHVTDCANAVACAPEPVDALPQRMAASTRTFADLVAPALPALKTLVPGELRAPVRVMSAAPVRPAVTAAPNDRDVVPEPLPERGCYLNGLTRPTLAAAAEVGQDPAPLVPPRGPDAPEECA